MIYMAHKKKKRPPRKVWFHHHNGELWADPFYSEAAAKRALTHEMTFSKDGEKVITLHQAGWRVVGPYIR